MKFILSYFLVVTASGVLNAQSMLDTGKHRNKILVVSGGGARGAWGVGVVSGLYKRSGGYQAVFGTSTGSLMAPLILLNQYDTLEQLYSGITQKMIFNENPFNVYYDPVTNTVTTKLKTFKAVKRLIFGKKTFGETLNLLKLIRSNLNYDRYCKLVDAYQANGYLLSVAVTNTTTGGIEIKNNADYTKTAADWERLCQWIWASANEPLLMSYVSINGVSYVDGGVREVIPIKAAIEYAAAHPRIDTIEVVINNSLVPESQNWSVAAGGIMNGLQRLLSIYNLSTVAYNENYSSLLIAYYNLTTKIPPDPNSALLPAEVVPKRKIHLRIYCMPDADARLYPNELGFVAKVMRDLIKKGKEFGNSPVHCIESDIDEQAIHAFLQQ